MAPKNSQGGSYSKNIEKYGGIFIDSDVLSVAGLLPK
jgi:hypothetical protein